MGNPKPAAAVQDPYGTGAPEDGIHFINMSPTPGKPTDGMSSLMRLYVPADTAWIEIGATSPPGIKAHATTHIGLYADSPSTKVELGTPTGGLHIDTAGHKKEHITHVVNEDYDAAKYENIGGEFVLNVTGATHHWYHSTLFNQSQARTEVVFGDWINTVNGNWNSTVSAGLNFQVTGGNIVMGASSNINMEAGGNVTIHATGKVDVKGDADHKWLQVGALKHLLLDAGFKLVVGMDTAINIGVKNDLRVAVHNDLRIGAHIDTKLAVLVQTNLGPKLWGGTLYNGKDLIHSALSAAICNAKTPLGLFKAAMWLDSAAMRILK